MAVDTLLCIFRTGYGFQSPHSYFFLRGGSGLRLTKSISIATFSYTFALEKRQ